MLGREAGVGKSRLADEYTVRARRTGARVLTDGCMPLGIDGLPFAPFTAMLRDLVHEMGQTRSPRCCPAGPHGSWPGCNPNPVCPPWTTPAPPGRDSSKRCSPCSDTSAH